MTIRNEELENPRNQKGFEKAQRHIIKSAGHVSKKKKAIQNKDGEGNENTIEVKKT